MEVWHSNKICSPMAMMKVSEQVIKIMLLHM